MSTEWQTSWQSACSLFTERTRLYTGLVKAQRIAVLEHHQRTLLMALAPHWRELSPNWKKPAEAFTGLLACLLSDESQALDQAREGVDLLAEYLASDDKARESFGPMIESLATLTSPMVNAHTEKMAVLEPLLTPLIGDIDSAEAIKDHAAIEALLVNHDATLLLNLTPGVPSRNYVHALGVAAFQGEPMAFERLAALQDQAPEWVMAAYGVIGSRDVAGILMDALSNPRLAKHAAGPWQLLSGEKLNWAKTMGMAGGRKTSGSLMPVMEPVEQWWASQQTESGPWLAGKTNVTATQVLQVLRTQVGEVTRPLWLLWYWYNRTTGTAPIGDWQVQRLKQLDSQANTLTSLDNKEGV